MIIWIDLSNIFTLFAFIVVTGFLIIGVGWVYILIRRAQNRRLRQRLDARRTRKDTD